MDLKIFLEEEAATLPDQAAELIRDLKSQLSHFEKLAHEPKPRDTAYGDHPPTNRRIRIGDAYRKLIMELEGLAKYYTKK